MKFLSYSKFISESSRIPLVKSTSEIVDGILSKAKKDGIIKYFINARQIIHNDIRRNNWYDDHPSTNFVYKDLYFESGCFFQIKKYEQIYVAAAEFFDYRERDLTTKKSIKIIVAAEDEFDLKEIENIFQENIECTLGKKVFKLKRQLEIDNSQNKTSINRRKFHSINSEQYNESVYFVIFNYSITIEQEKDITYNDLIQTQEFKDLMKDYPLEVISSELQKRKMTIVFALKGDSFFDPNMKEVKPGQKYLEKGYALYQKGYIRIYSTTGNRHVVAGKFDASTIEGWKDGLRQIKEKIKNQINYLEKMDVIWSKEKLNPRNISIEKQKDLIKRALEGKISWFVIEPYVFKKLLKPYSADVIISKMGF